MRYIGTTPNQYGDTLLTSDANDQINVKVAGAEDFRIAANTLSVLSGTTLNIDSGATIANSGTATGFGGVDTSGTPANNQLAIFTDADTVEGDSNLTYDGTDLILAGGNVNVDSGNGIDFSATGDATGMVSELFDDYEEGVYNPTITGETSGSWTVDASDNTLAYTIVGRVCHVQGQIATTTDNSASGTAQLSLPVTAASLTENADLARTPMYLRDHGDAGIEQAFISVGGGSSVGKFVNITDAGGQESITHARLGVAFIPYFAFSYIIA